MQGRFRRQFSLRRASMSLSFASVFLVRESDGDGSSTEVLSIHAFDGPVCRFERVVHYESKSATLLAVHFGHDARGQYGSELCERIEQHLFVHIQVERTDKQLGVELLVGRLLRGAVDFHVTTVQLNV
jgi:hypothetical protein